MFTPLNEEFNTEKLKKIAKEKRKLKKLYYNYFLNKKLDEVFTYVLVYEENLHFFEIVKDYVLYNFIRSKKKINIELYKLTTHKRALLEYIEICINDGKFIKGKKLLNKAKENGFTNNKYYELEERIKEEYYYDWKCN